MTLKTSKYAWYAMRVREKIKFMNAVNAMNNMKKEKKKKNKKLTISLSCGKHPTWKSRNQAPQLSNNSMFVYNVKSSI